MRDLFKVHEPLGLLWVVPIGHARSRKQNPGAASPLSMHKEVYDRKKLRRDADILPWPKS